MKRRTFCKAAALFAAGSLLPGTACAAQPTGVVGRAVADGYYPVSFRSIYSQKDLTHAFYYSESFFEHTAMEYDHLLALMTFGLANAAINSYQSEDAVWKEKDPRRTADIAQAFCQLGFANTEYVGYDQSVNALTDADGCALAQKTLQTNGVRRTIFAIMLRPTYYGVEWADNLHTGDGPGHAGFIAAADRIWEDIRKYLDAAGKKRDLGTIRVWLGGYSRGAAIANLLAAKIANAMPEIPKENIYAYTFAAPAALTAADRPDLQQEYDNNHSPDGSLKPAWDSSNIFNLISSGDIVPRVLPTAWGCRRNGNDRFLPATTLQSEQEALDALKEELGGNLLQSADLATAEQMDAVMAALLRACPDQKTYHEKYEDAFRDMMLCSMMRSEEEVLQGAVLDEEAVVARLRQLPNLRAMPWSKVASCVLAASGMSNLVLERFGDAVPLRAKQLVVPVLAVGLCHEVEMDVLRMAAYYMIGLAGARGRLDNVLRSVMCHFPENYISLLEYYDPSEHGMEAYTR